MEGESPSADETRTLPLKVWRSRPVRWVKRLTKPVWGLVLPARAGRRTKRSMMAEVSGLYAPPGHYYSPIPSGADVDAAEQVVNSPPASLPGVDLRTDGQLSLIETLAPFAKNLDLPYERTTGRRYFSTNPWFSRGDAALTSAMLQHLRPHRLVEVGCGFSSAMILDTNDHDLGDGLHCTFIEPSPEILKDLARAHDFERHSLIERTVQDVGPEPFEDLSENDVLFVDSSHVAKAGSDVNLLLFEILPRLRPGVVVHFHDVFYPFEYRLDWLREGRAWNEAYMLRAFLEYNESFEILVFASYLIQLHQEALVKSIPDYGIAHGASLWLRKAR